MDIVLHGVTLLVTTFNVLGEINQHPPVTGQANAFETWLSGSRAQVYNFISCYSELKAERSLAVGGHSLGLHRAEMHIHTPVCVLEVYSITFSFL